MHRLSFVQPSYSLSDIRSQLTPNNKDCYTEHICLPPVPMTGEGLAMRLPIRFRKLAVTVFGGSDASDAAGAEVFLAVGNAGNAGFSFSFLIS